MSRPHRGVAITAVCALSAAVLLATSPAAVGVESGIRINEVESSGGTPGDWIEFYNASGAAVDLSGYTVQDDNDDNSYTFPDGTVVEPGAYLVIDELIDGAGDFDYGLGGTDRVRLSDPSGALVDDTTWSGHAATTWGAREVDGAVEWEVTKEATKGAANMFESEAAEGGSIVINEVDSQPADWVELYNPGDEALDVSGYEIRDNSDDHRWRFPAGTTIGPGEFLVVEDRKSVV